MSIMHMHRAQLEDAKSTIQSEVISTGLTDNVEEPINNMVKMLGDDTWMGWGADSFSEDCANYYLPKMTDIRQACENLIQRIDESIDEIDAMDKECQKQAQDLARQFREVVSLLR